MNVTKLAGWILLLMTAAYLVVTFISFGPKYAAAGYIGSKAEQFGLQTTVTNLRFQMGLELCVDILCIGVLAIAGWWLTTQEVVQIAWIIIIGLFTVFSIIIRSTPVLPFSVAKLSPAAAFYGAQLELPVVANASDPYVVITRKQNMQVVYTGTPTGEQADLAVLNLNDPAGSRDFRSCTAYPVTIKANVSGTACIALKRKLTTVPLLTVKSAVMGLPQRK